MFERFAEWGGIQVHAGKISRPSVGRQESTCGCDIGGKEAEDGKACLSAGFARAFRGVDRDSGFLWTFQAGRGEYTPLPTRVSPSMNRLFCRVRTPVMPIFRVGPK
jgi:hypothetical protein